MVGPISTPAREEPLSSEPEGCQRCVVRTVQDEGVSTKPAETAALFWFADLKDREVRGWRKIPWSIKTIVGGFVGHAPDVADLVIIRLDTRDVIYSRPAGDVTQAGQMLLTAKRELSEMSREQFAAEWSFNRAAGDVAGR